MLEAYYREHPCVATKTTSALPFRQVVLAALAERGQMFRLPRQNSTVDRLRVLIDEAPQLHWTAHEAGRVFAMSEATLRRRLAQEQMHFETLLVDIRMYHGMMLLQTTS